MRRRITAALGVVLAVGLTAATSVSPAAPRASGKESFRGVLVASGESGTRAVISTLIVARGVFTEAGRIVEVPNRPGDSRNVSRDDLVFPQGKMHLVSTNKSFRVTVNPNTCAVKVRIRQTGKITGGTGKFRHAHGTGTGGVRGRGVAARNPDGTCSQQGALILEVDLVFSHGTLSL
jgi:hypothetical protein